MSSPCSTSIATRPRAYSRRFSAAQREQQEVEREEQQDGLVDVDVRQRADHREEQQDAAEQRVRDHRDASAVRWNRPYRRDSNAGDAMINQREQHAASAGPLFVGTPRSMQAVGDAALLTSPRDRTHSRRV